MINRRGFNAGVLGGALTAGLAGPAAAQPKKSLAFVVNSSSNFWTFARRGIEKANKEHPDYAMELIIPSEATAAEQRRVRFQIVDAHGRAYLATYRCRGAGTESQWTLAAGDAVPDWVKRALPALPEEMTAGDRRAGALERAVVDATEAWLLQGREGDTFAAVVVDAEAKHGTVVLDEPAVRATCDGADLPVGTRIRVRLDVADVAARKVRFGLAG